MTFKIDYILTFFAALAFFSCNNVIEKSANVFGKSKDSAISCMMVPSRFSEGAADTSLAFNGDTSTIGMAYIKAGTFMMGGDNNQASADEFPKHKVHVDGFWMDETEVTNAEFQEFVDATHYVTTAEKKTGLGRDEKNTSAGHTKAR